MKELYPDSNENLKKKGNSNENSFNGFVFLDREKEKKWEDLDAATKNFFLSNLQQTMKITETSIMIEMLGHAINDINDRLKKLEEK